MMKSFASDKLKSRYVGGHVSTSGSLEKAVERGQQITANAIQIFSGSPRVWARKPLADVDTNGLLAANKRADFAPIVTHALYLVNLASDKPEQVAKSQAALVYDLRFDAAIQGGGVVVHLGSHQGKGWLVVREQLLKNIAEIIAQAPANSRFLIENSAGQNGKLCSELSEIKWLIKELQSPQVGWCFDTCHAFCAGYSLAAKANDNLQAQKPDLQRSKTAAQEIGELDLWSSLGCVHVNDSRDAFGSGRDRHANIGAGNIPMEDLRYFLNLPDMPNVPLLLEVPGEDGNGPDAINVQLVRELVS